MILFSALYLRLKYKLKKYSKFFGLIFVVILSISLFIYRDVFINLQPLGLLGLFVISILGNATIILPMPVVLTAFVGGSVFNPLVVAIVISLGATIGELTGYLAGLSGRETVDTDKKFKKIKTWMDRYGLWTLFVLAAIPNPLFDLAGIVAGAYRIKLYKYFMVVFFGKLIKFGMISFLGANSVKLIGTLI